MPRAIVVASPTNPSLVRTTNLGALDCATNIKAPPYDWKYWARIKRTHNIRIVCWSYVNCQALAYDWKYLASKVRYTNANNPEVRGLELLRYYVNHRKPLQCIGWQWNVLVLPLLIIRMNRKNHIFVPWLMFVKINFVWMRIIRVPRETDFACYLIKPRRNCFQVNSILEFVNT